VIILRINLEDSGCEGQLPGRVAGSLDNRPAMEPNLIILRVVVSERVHVIEFLSQVDLQMGKDLSSVLPEGTGGGHERSPRIGTDQIV
jgi:hypothetical protein